ncbi:MAG: ribonuclease III domain-containing protein [Lachnospiraceae bacterium]|nr:ribonuclease III domain-containing protein [Lachnospiraceae bacterium]
MEESLSFLEKITLTFPETKVNIQSYSPLTLAYIGDSIYDLCIRTLVVEKGNRSPNTLHRDASRLVNAAAQSAMADAILSDLTDEEVTVFKRGRNAKSYTTAKNASVSDYRKATGLEALFGYLYLRDETDRLLFLLRMGLERIELYPFK